MHPRTRAPRGSTPLRLLLAVGLATLLTAALATAAAGSPYAPDGDLDVTDTAVAPGGQTTVRGDGFRSGSQVEVLIFSEPVVLGSARADAAGEISLTITIPASFAAGSTHTVQMQGVDPSGEVRVLEQTITLAGGSDGGFAGLPETGFTGSTWGVLAAVLLATGAALLGVARSRSRRRAADLQAS